ncbi:MAG: hypothetical protein WDN28_07010 [Chthoniobacter sp.]
MNEAFNDSEVVLAAHFTEDGTLLASKGEDPRELAMHLCLRPSSSSAMWTSLGAENLKEINLLAPEQKALCLVDEKSTTVLVTTPKANFPRPRQETRLIPCNTSSPH